MTLVAFLRSYGLQDDEKNDGMVLFFHHPVDHNFSKKATTFISSAITWYNSLANMVKGYV